MLDRTSGEALLNKIDEFAAELARFRSEIVAALPPPAGNGSNGGDDFSPEHLIEISTAAERFNVPADTLRHWCRHSACGERRGGRWLVSPSAIRRRLNRE